MGALRCTTTQLLIVLLASSASAQPKLTDAIKRIDLHKHFIYKHGTTTSWGKR